MSNVFYVRNDGDDKNNGRSHSDAWKTLNKASSSVKSGDQLFFFRGDTWHESLKIENLNGVSIGAYGDGPENPHLSAAPFVTDWTDENIDDKKIYIYNPPNKAMQVFLDEVRLSHTDTDDPATLEKHKWIYTDKLYVNVDTNPYYHQLRVTTWISACISIKNCRNILVENINVSYSAYFGIQVVDSSYIKIENVTANMCRGTGFSFGVTGLPPEATETECEGNQLINCISTGSISNGMQIAHQKKMLVSGCWSYGNCLGVDYTVPTSWLAGIKFNGSSCTGNIIENNKSYFNEKGAGIWLDFNGSGNIIRNNETFKNGAHGIFNELTSGTIITGNKSYQNDIGIYVYGRAGEHPLNGKANYNLIQDNESFQNSWMGIAVQSNGDGQYAAHNMVIDNKAYRNGQTELRLGGGSEKKDAQNIVLHNYVGAEHPKMLEFGWGVYKGSHQAWNTAIGYDSLFKKT